MQFSPPTQSGHLTSSLEDPERLRVVALGHAHFLWDALISVIELEWYKMPPERGLHLLLRLCLEISFRLYELVNVE